MATLKELEEVKLKAEAEKFSAEAERAKAEKLKTDLEIVALKKAEAVTELPNVFSDIIKAVTQFGAGLAGIAIIVGVMGFLSEQMHNGKLGIVTAMSNPFDYIAAGGQLLLYTGATIICYGYGWFVLAPLILCAGIFFSLKRSAKSHLDNPELKTEINWEETITLSMTLVFLGYTLFRMTGLLSGYSDYLNYAMEKTQINDWIVSSDFSHLRQAYASYCTPIFIIILALGYWYWKKNQYHVRFFYSNTILKVSTMLVTIFAIIGLGLIYGIILGDYAYPHVTEYGIKKKENNPFFNLSYPIDSSRTSFTIDSLYLIKKNEKELIFYDKPRYQVFYVNADVLSYFKVTKTENIFRGRKTLAVDKKKKNGS